VLIAMKDSATVSVGLPIDSTSASNPAQSEQARG
jgi:hypothetical protein